MRRRGPVKDPSGKSESPNPHQSPPQSTPRVRFGTALTDQEKLTNWKEFQRALDKLKVNKEINVNRLSKGLATDCLDLLKWLKALWNSMDSVDEYDPLERRGEPLPAFGLPPSPLLLTPLRPPQLEPTLPSTRRLTRRSSPTPTGKISMPLPTPTSVPRRRRLVEPRCSTIRKNRMQTHLSIQHIPRTLSCRTRRGRRLSGRPRRRRSC